MLQVAMSYNRTPLSIDDIAKYAPAVLAQGKHESRGDKYCFISTLNMLEFMRKEGFYPFLVKQSITKTGLERIAHTKHMIRFRHINHMSGIMNNLGELYPEIVLINAHDGTSSYRISCGLYRLVCQNGLIVSKPGRQEYKIMHKGNVQDDIIDVSYKVLSDINNTLPEIQEWAGIDLSRQEQLALAESAHYIRFADSDGNIKTPIKAEQLLTPRRYGDQHTDLFTTFNVIQENAVKGGLQGVSVSPQNKRRKVRTKGVKEISADLNLNRALFELTRKMAELKS